MSSSLRNYTAFSGESRIAHGNILPVVRNVRESLSDTEIAAVLLFDDATGKVVDIDWRGGADVVAGRLEEASSEETSPSPERGVGRPKLGVVAREVTLLPRHWEWLASQPGGASVTLRKLVEEARKRGEGADSARRAREATYCFISAMAGNQPGFEEATRALFAGDLQRFSDHSAAWPADIRAYAHGMAAPGFEGAS